MGSLFSKSKDVKHKITEQDLAILNLKRQRDKIKVLQKRYELNTTKEKELAKKLINEGRKDRAVFCLKRKKYQEAQIDRIHGYLNTIETIISDIEMAQLSSQVIEKIAQGNEALKSLNEEYTVEEVERIMEECREAGEHQEEISSILTRGLTADDVEDVEEEYEKMIQEQLPVPIESQYEFPTVPEGVPSAEKQNVRKKEKEAKRAVEAS